MNNRKKVAGLSLTSTILQGIMVLQIVVTFVVLVIVLIILSVVLKESIETVEYIDPDSVTAGWEALFDVSGGVAGFLVWLIIILAIILLIGPLIAEIFVFIYGIRTYKKRDTTDFKRMVKNDSIVKLVISAVTVITSLSSIDSPENLKMLVEEFVGMLFITLPSTVVVIVSIIALKNIKYIEELPDDSHPQDIDYNEDNSSYFGQ